MSRLKDLTNQRFGRLLVIKKVEQPNHIKNYRTYWLCKCDCGNLTVVLSPSLLRNNTLSCGCLKKETIKNRSLNFGECAFNRIYRQYKRVAKKRGFEFLLSKEEFKLLTKDNCYYCGDEPSNKCNSENDTGYYIYNGIDRLDSTIGYIYNNCVPCCYQCNRAKSNLNIEDFLKWIDKVYEFKHHRKDII